MTKIPPFTPFHPFHPNRKGLISLDDEDEDRLAMHLPAKLADGRVVMWGDADYGGDSSKLQNVKGFMSYMHDHIDSLVCDSGDRTQKTRENQKLSSYN